VSNVVSLVVIVVTLANIAGCMWLLWILRKGRQPGEADTTGHVWDGDLREWNNPLPRWWLWLFVLTVIFSLVYVVLYPGLGSFAGTLGWSQQSQHEAQAEANEARIRATLAPFENQPVAVLATDADALRVGRNLFVNNCATCHGSDGRGAPGFPNLADRDWLWGGSPEAIVETIANGRTGVMTPWGDALGRQGVEDVLAYVLNLSGRKVPAGNVARGKVKFEQTCVACHGADGRGNQQLGAPDLTDSVWLHGGAIDTIRQTIVNGRQGQMPAHTDLLGDTRVKLLAAYVLSLGAAEQRQTALDGQLSARR
jgi:cytochrome c oxidase cbb3-type subunit 3